MCCRTHFPSRPRRMVHSRCFLPNSISIRLKSPAHQFTLCACTASVWLLLMYPEKVHVKQKMAYWIYDWLSSRFATLWVGLHLSFCHPDLISLKQKVVPKLVSREPDKPSTLSTKSPLLVWLLASSSKLCRPKSRDLGSIYFGPKTGRQGILVLIYLLGVHNWHAARVHENKM